MNRTKDKEYILLKNKIQDNNKKVWCPNINYSFENKDTNSWFNFLYYENKEIKNESLNFKINKNNNDLFKCLKIDVDFNEEQKKVIHRWFKSYILMYNATLNLIKERYANKENTILNYKTLRTKYLKEIKENIKKGSQIDYIQKNTRIKAHMLDGAIKLACANYKSALTNFKRGNIKSFRIKKWKINKDCNILDIETCYFIKGTLCPNELGNVNCYYNNQKFDLTKIGKEYTSECKLLYEQKIDKYTLLVPVRVEKTIETQNKAFVSLDPGIRTFMTGISENEIIKIGDNCQGRIIKLLKKKDKLNSYKTKNKKIRKILKNVHYKLKNLITDMHWKSINYLTKTYKTVLIGDLSVKGISNKKTSNISKMTKRVGYELSFYKFRQRLAYKSEVNNCNCLVVNEKYTSKMCSNCGSYKKDLGSNKTYNCNNCKTIIDRDVNGCRCICLKSF